MTLRLYLAGPDVFRPQPAAHGEALKTLCAEYGFTGLYPLDNAIAPRADGPSTAAEIYRQNIALLDSADAVMANVADFRGYEPDSGTCFEIGYAIARGKDVWCYLVPTAPLVAQVPNIDGTDVDGWAVEDFGLPRNLMLACSSRLVVGDARACLAQMRVHYAPPPKSLVAIRPRRLAPRAGARFARHPGAAPSLNGSEANASTGAVVGRIRHRIQ